MQAGAGGRRKGRDRRQRRRVPQPRTYNNGVIEADFEELTFGAGVRGVDGYAAEGSDGGSNGTGRGGRGRRGAGRARGPRKARNPRTSKRIWPRVLASMLALILLASGGAGCWWMWRTYWRTVPVMFNGTEVAVRVGQSLGSIIDEHDGFGAKPGRLMSLTGKVVDKRGGEAVSATLDGRDTAIDALRALRAGDLDRGTDGAGSTDSGTHRVTLASGKDVTEGHTVEHEAIPHGSEGTDIATGGTIQLRWPGKDGQRKVWVGKASGEKVDKGVIEQPTDSRTTALSPKPPADRKVIALTFDDGPSQYTPQMLDILKAKGAHATFFDVGTQSKGRGDIERRIVAEGHQLASHSNTHPNMPTLSTDALRAELKAGFDQLAANGTNTRMLRSPYGAFTNADWDRAGDLISANVLWDIDTLDWKRPGAQAIADTVLSQAHNGAIVLMHTGGGDRSQTVEALPLIIDGLKARGYEFVTVGELMALDQSHRFPAWAINAQLPPQ